MAIAILLTAVPALLITIRAIALISRDGVVHYCVRGFRRAPAAARLEKRVRPRKPSEERRPLTPEQLENVY